jgi:hypothetical protein
VLYATALPDEVLANPSPLALECTSTGANVPLWRTSIADCECNSVSPEKYVAFTEKHPSESGAFPENTVHRQLSVPEETSSAAMSLPDASFTEIRALVAPAGHTSATSTAEEAMLLHARL